MTQASEQSTGAVPCQVTPRLLPGPEHSPGFPILPAPSMGKAWLGAGTGCLGFSLNLEPVLGADSTLCLSTHLL